MIQAIWLKNDIIYGEHIGLTLRGLIFHNIWFSRRLINILMKYAYTTLPPDGRVIVLHNLQMTVKNVLYS